MEPVVPGKFIAPGFVMYWFGADLYYANANRFIEEARRLVNDSPAPVRWLGVDASAITAVDFSAARALIELQQDLAKQGVVLVLARVNASLQAALDRQGVTAAIGADRIFSSRKHCLATCRASSTDPIPKD